MERWVHLLIMIFKIRYILTCIFGEYKYWEDLCLIDKRKDYNLDIDAADTFSTIFSYYTFLIIIF